MSFPLQTESLLGVILIFSAWRLSRWEIISQNNLSGVNSGRNFGITKPQYDGVIIDFPCKWIILLKFFIAIRGLKKIENDDDKYAVY